jgi:DNA-binding FrmR family transcriptional regulator
MHISSDHTHGADGHPHVHNHTHTKAVLNRLARAAGHLEYVRRMVEEGQDCTDVLMQLAAVKSALNNTAKIILKDHIEHCIVDAVASNDEEAINDLNKAIERFME